MIKGTSFLREKNKRRLLAKVRELNETSRQELVNLMGVSKNTVSLIVDELINEGIIVEKGSKEPGLKGRPPIRIQINREGYRAIGFTFNQYELKYIVVDYYGDTVEERTINLNGTDHELVLSRITEIIESLIAKYKLIIGIGIGVPGIVDVDEKMILTSTSLNWKEVSFKKLNAFTVPIHIHNSVNMGGLDAMIRNGFVEDEGIFYIRVGEGVGGSYLYGKEIIYGASWTAGEVGHISIDSQGPKCRCGQVGCLEMLINHRSVINKLKKEGIEIAMKGEDLFFTDEQLKSLSIQSVIGENGAYLGRALIQIIHLINPKYILIDSSYNQFDVFSKQCEHMINQHTLPASIRSTKITFENQRNSLCKGSALVAILYYENYTNTI
ncbi:MULTISPECIES: ROK family transcriptional regulator [Sporosarcina]|uniref:ROK family transcriptional regulator n=1 Tax=Sporosarcina TaxID=1569 RepID=UPI00129BA52E|nr:MULTISPECIES: ROK family protein [Sporosarcina]GKV66571.1 transcriptional regulator [Sporosarcina sp. NCCP-2331]GLB56848.1 transcriptional regulator [Sporosarcina sp. NCCP-2378]